MAYTLNGITGKLDIKGLAGAGPFPSSDAILTETGVASTISGMSAGGPAVATDEIAIARSGTNRKLTLAEVATFVNANGWERKGTADSSGALPTGPYSDGWAYFVSADGGTNNFLGTWDANCQASFVGQQVLVGDVIVWFTGGFVKIDNTEVRLYDATVGVSGEYATIASAVADNKYNLLVVGATTEPSDITFTQSLSITFQAGNFVDMGDYQFIYGAGGIDLIWDSVASSSGFTWSPTTSKALVDGNGQANLRFFRSGTLTINGEAGTADDCPLYSQDITNGIVSTGITIIQLPDQNGWGLHPSPTQILFENGQTVFVQTATAGTNCYNLISDSQVINNVILVGLFSSTPGNYVIDTAGGSINTFTRLDFAPSTIYLNIGGCLDNASVKNGVGIINVDIANNNACIRNVDLNGGDIDVNSSTGVSIQNTTCNDIFNTASDTALVNVLRTGDTKRVIDNTDIDRYKNITGDWNTLYSQVKCATIANGTLATDFEAGDVVDGYTLVAGDAILLKNQTAGQENGIYIVQSSGAPIRAPYYDTSDEIRSTLILIQFGTVNYGNMYQNTNTSAITVNTTPITYAVFSTSDTQNRLANIEVFGYAETVTTGDGKRFFRIPAELNGYNLVSIGAQVVVASSSGTPTIQIARGRQSAPNVAHAFVDMLQTLFPLTIDANEFDSKDATTPAVINTSNDDIATGDMIRIDVDTAGTGTTGLCVTLSFRLP